MKKIVYSFVFIFALIAFVACERDPVDVNNSVIPERTAYQTAFDRWLYENITSEYNIRLIYRFEDIEADPRHNVIPVRLRQAEVMAQIIQHVWLAAYDEAVDSTFTRSFQPRLVQLIGSNAYLEHGRILGTAEGGLKVSLFNVNAINEHNLDPVMLNREFFHTIHHEFAHILHQRRMFSDDFQRISDAYYIMGSWIDYANPPGVIRALQLGFITPYSRFNHYEDFVELFSVYVTNTPEEWNRRLAIARTGGPPSRPGVTGEDVINQKMDILRDYMLSVWNLCIYRLRDVVLRRSAEVVSPDFYFIRFDDDVPTWRPPM